MEKKSKKEKNKKNKDEDQKSKDDTSSNSTSQAQSKSKTKSNTKSKSIAKSKSKSKSQSRSTSKSPLKRSNNNSNKKSKSTNNSKNKNSNKKATGPNVKRSGSKSNNRYTGSIKSTTKITGKGGKDKASIKSKSNKHKTKQTKKSKNSRDNIDRKKNIGVNNGNNRNDKTGKNQKRKNKKNDDKKIQHSKNVQMRKDKNRKKKNKNKSIKNDTRSNNSMTNEQGLKKGKSSINKDSSRGSVLLKIEESESILTEFENSLSGNEGLDTAIDHDQGIGSGRNMSTRSSGSSNRNSTNIHVRSDVQDVSESESKSNLIQDAFCKDDDDDDDDIDGKYNDSEQQFSDPTIITTTRQKCHQLNKKSSEMKISQLVRFDSFEQAGTGAHVNSNDDPELETKMNNHEHLESVVQINDNNNKYNNNNDYNIYRYNHLMSKMNTTIETSISSTERWKVFSSLFEQGTTGVYCNSYMTANSFVNILKTCFGSYKYNINNNELPLQSQFNLKCVKFILNNSKILQQAIESLEQKQWQKKKSSLVKYFSNYKHKCYDSNNYFGGYPNDNNISSIMIDMLRNLLFQAGIVCRIIRYLTLKVDPRIQVAYDIKVFNVVGRYLELGLIDTTIENYHVSLYHVMTQYRKHNLLKLLLIYIDQDWSLMKDGTGQV